ncbi:hypothetical protein BI347_03120 [Chromobacterium sphagni]|uniref:Uncharacterized protein n=1 Tax=Chromobacterium sphagni TaxID=1903179 RepID=A0A1S1WZL8_9NEIS|nr:hypothetical protein BI347_03120 [Chromobacterium sphagni]OHX21310.1 hypothetical protein BI344_01885 [Chromobacterium sphagni]
MLALLLERLLAPPFPAARPSSTLPFDICGFGIAYALCSQLPLHPADALRPGLLPASVDAGLAALLIAGMARLLRQALNPHPATACPPAPPTRRIARHSFRLGNLTTSPYPARAHQEKRK